MKTAVAVLQEMMVKQGQLPQYDCSSQIGPQHQATFEYRCTAAGHSVIAKARSKKEAKQEAARLLLLELAKSGTRVPPPYGLDVPTRPGPCNAPTEATTATNAGREFVALLKELVVEYNLPAVEYDLVGDTGPPHLRQFTISARVGQQMRQATSTTKKAARQLAAEQLYKYLRDNLKVTRDFVEEVALTRAHEKVMQRFEELTGEHVWRPNLAQRIADYHLGLVNNVDDEKLTLMQQAMTSGGSSESALSAAASLLGLSVACEDVDTYNEPLVLVRLRNVTPELAFAGSDREAASREALEYFGMALRLARP